jgi:serine protease
MSSRIVLLGVFLALAALTLTPLIGAIALTPDTVGAVTGGDNDPRVTGIDYMPIYNPATQAVQAATGISTEQGNLINHGGRLLTNQIVYICYWGWTSDPYGEKPYYEGFLNSVGGSAWLGQDNQYGVSNPSGILKGTWSDTTSVPTRPTQTQVNNAGARCEAHFGYNAQADYIVATPSGHSQSGFGTQWCAYHEGLSVGGQSIAVTYFPYIHDAGASCGQNFVNANGPLDGVSIVGGHEMAEAQTDPLPCTGWCDSSNAENGDKCAWTPQSHDITLGGKVYAVQPLWSNAISGCASSP